jgi:hypothetical protein
MDYEFRDKKQGKLMHTVKLSLMISTLAAALVGCSATINEYSFFPNAALTPPKAKLAIPDGYASTDKMIDISGLGTVRTVFLDNPNSDATIIYSAGNGGFVDSDRTSKAAANLATVSGADIILYDYPGRGGTTIPATIEAAIAVGPKLVEQFKSLGWLGKGPSFAYGFSFGGSMASAMSRNGGFSGLVIEGSAADYEKIGRDFVPGIAKPFVKLKVSPELKQFDYLGYALSAKAPILLLSGVDDRTIQQKHMRSFGDQLAAKGAKITFQSTPGGHGDSLNTAEGQAALRSFFAVR